jgi:two-component system sensor histidine kinase HydH
MTTAASDVVAAPRLARWSRVAVFAAIAGMAAALFVLVWTTDRGVRSASATVLRGESSSIYSALRSRVVETSPVEGQLPSVADGLRGDGLLHVALIENGTIVARGGATTASDAALIAWASGRDTGVPAILDDDRARVVYRKPRTWSPPSAPTEGKLLVFEFSPRVATGLRASATRTLVIGSLAALTLIAIALVMVRWSLRREHQVRSVEQARHLARLGQMSAVMAHEIRNPLASLKGNAQLLAASLPAGEKPRTKAERVVEDATRLETLTNDLLEFAKAGDVHLAEVDPVTLVRDVAAGFGDRVAVDADDAPRSWQLDPTKMRQVLVNLVENAVEMSEGTVDVTVERGERALVMAVRDRGPGVPDADLDRIFEPFFTKRTRGTGLGLAVARRLVELHGGTIAARNADGGGARFEVTIPR